MSGESSNTGAPLPLSNVLHMIPIKLSSTNYLLWQKQMLPLLAYSKLRGMSIGPPLSFDYHYTTGDTFSTTQRLITPRPNFRELIYQAESHKMFLQTISDSSVARVGFLVIKAVLLCANYAALKGPVTAEEKIQKKNESSNGKKQDWVASKDCWNTEVKGTASSSSSSQNMAFVSSPSSTNEVNTAYGVSTANTQVSPASTQVSTASTQVNTANLSDDTVYAFLASQPNGSQLVYEDLEQIHEDDIEEMDLKWQLALLSMRTRRFFQKTGRKITINRSDTVGYDKSKVECFNCHKMGHFARECRGPRNQDSRNRNQDSSRRTINVEETSSKAMVAIDGAGFDWSYMADDEVPTNMALMAFSDSKVHNDKTCSKTCLKSFETLKTQLDDLRIEFNKSEFNLATYKRGLASVEEQLVFYKKNEVIFCEQLVVLKREISYKDSELSMLKRSQITDKSKKGVGFVSYNVVPPPHIGLFSPPNLDLSYFGLEEFQQSDTSNEVRESPDAPLVNELVLDDKLEKKTADCNYHQRGRAVSRNNYIMVNYNYSAKKTHPSAHRNMVPRAVLMKTGLKSLNTASPVNTARPVNTAHPKTTVYSARPMSHFSKSAQSTEKRPYQIRTTLTNKNFSQKVNTAKGKFYTARPKAVNTARSNSTVVNAVRANQVNAVKASAYWFLETYQT
ncbi:ribonuclease H-like domain-containing protein [Tanacetum coccineum]